MNRKLFENIPLPNREGVVMLDDFIVSSSTARRYPAHFAMMAREGNGFPLFEPGNMENASETNAAVLESSGNLGRSVRRSARAFDNLGEGGS
jgi:hypothetical protein